MNVVVKTRHAFHATPVSEEPEVNADPRGRRRLGHRPLAGRERVPLRDGKSSRRRITPPEGVPLYYFAKS